ncbi:MAG: sigma-54 dependent transcriptional regulator [Acidobacteriota bacterium]|nr:sigma-54 dependent transcriptional regulator [Acidobacteriota bacterium]
MAGSPADRHGAHEGTLESRFLGTTEAAKNVRKQIRRAARVDFPVLIQGESGVGKELVAREIHARSSRAAERFVPINCAAIPDSLIESELFGHVAGAFTGAERERRGAFEMAHYGTLFLDEVGDLSGVAQPKLLRALETNEVLPVGGDVPKRVDIRIIAATNHDLKTMRREGRFRSDLYYRLDVINIRVPPLRERIGDVAEIAERFAAAVAKKSKREFGGFDREAIELLRAHSWPGNVRELRTVIERAMAMSSGLLLDSTCFRIDPVTSPGLSLRALLKEDWKSANRSFELTYTQQLLREHGGNVYKAAQAAKIAPRTLYKILARLGLQPGPEKPSDRSGGGGGS